MEPLAPWRIWVQLAVVGMALGLAVVRPFPILRIVVCCMASMIAYGIVQDQFTVRICPEYFTVGHPPIAGLTDPTLLGITWGFLGAWWGGLCLGLALAITMHVGRSPPLTMGQLARPMALLFLAVASVAILCGLGTNFNAGLLGVKLGEPWASQIPPERHRAMLVVANAHFGAYGSAVVGAIVVCEWASRKRRWASACATDVNAQRRH